MWAAVVESQPSGSSITALTCTLDRAFLPSFIFLGSPRSLSASLSFYLCLLAPCFVILLCLPIRSRLFSTTDIRFGATVDSVSRGPTMQSASRTYREIRLWRTTSHSDRTGLTRHMTWRGALRSWSTLLGRTWRTTSRSSTSPQSLLHRTRRGGGTTTSRCTRTGGGSLGWNWLGLCECLSIYLPHFMCLLDRTSIIVACVLLTLASSALLRSTAILTACNCCLVCGVRN